MAGMHAPLPVNVRLDGPAGSASISNLQPVCLQRFTSSAKVHVKNFMYSLQSERDN